MLGLNNAIKVFKFENERMVQIDILREKVGDVKVLGFSNDGKYLAAGG